MKKEKKQEDEDQSNLEIVYKAETEDDIAALARSLLKVRSIALMSKRFVEGCIELKEGYYDLQEAFDTIQMLIEPALTFLCYDAYDHLKAFTKRKAA